MANRILLRSRYKVQGTRYKVQGTRYKVQGTRYKVQGTRYKVQGTRYKGKGERGKGKGERKTLGQLAPPGGRFLLVPFPLYLVPAVHRLSFFSTLLRAGSVASWVGCFVVSRARSGASLVLFTNFAA